MSLFGRWLDWWEKRRVAAHIERRERFRSECRRRGIPADVTERLLRAGATRIDWYAGRRHG